ncbi:hypothetical protein [Sphaerimonospora thailandensis]|uniref:Uncharacterized protein n=1 Tax=Sphaerimonospora thailandensis TaxID=795644 RepID=A0A8J3R611_9ACTN|nr:hypothetical protein [Sphaerimonospora thailandensis]GIH69757.1 hypothetical protein Mth01_20100 [Sphaerimonospora thailandensis]
MGTACNLTRGPSLPWSGPIVAAIRSCVSPWPAWALKFSMLAGIEVPEVRLYQREELDTLPSGV